MVKLTSQSIFHDCTLSASTGTHPIYAIDLELLANLQKMNLEILLSIYSILVICESKVRGFRGRFITAFTPVDYTVCQYLIQIVITIALGMINCRKGLYAKDQIFGENGYPIVSYNSVESSLPFSSG